MKLKHSPVPTAVRNEVLAVSASDEDLRRLRGAFGRSSWELYTARTVDEARAMLRGNTMAAVLCARHLPDGEWKTLLEFADGLAQPPKFIVFSRHADHRLWAEVLSFGGFDLLAFPASPQEIFRAINSCMEELAEGSQEHSAAAGIHSL